MRFTHSHSPRLGRLWVFLWLGVLGAQAQTVWDGPTVTFTRPDGVDHTLEANQDRITDNVWITRANTMGIFNIRTEGSYSRNSSPADTEWASGTTANFDSLNYTTWESWAQNLGGPPSTVGVDAVVHLISEDIYIDIRFTSWTAGGGGGFSYERSTAPADNMPPTVSITSPADGANFPDPTEVTIEADASDSDGTVAQVEFFDGEASLGVAMSEPYSVSASLSEGSHTLTAVATDDGDAMTTSEPVQVTVGGDGMDGMEIENPIAETIPKGDIIIEFEEVAAGMTAPLGMAVPDDDSGRMFVHDQAGLVYVIENGQRLETPLLDVSDRLVNLGVAGPGSFDERGLLGLAVHPGFAENPLIYTYTSEPVNGPADFSIPLPVGEEFNHQSVVAEWRIDESNPNQVDPASRRELLRIDEPQFNHNAGNMHFGPDGLLYIVIGDGGAGDDQGLGHAEGGNGQDITNIYGTIIRIDPDGNNSSNGQYGIPEDNPFVGETGLDEIFAYGLRNPFAFGFDLVTGELILGDVGQNDIEEIDLILKGGNYGWNIKEGSFFFDPNGGDDGFVTTEPVTEVPDNLIDPIAEYDHDDGLSVIGGFVYRGNRVPRLAGKYVTGDFQRPGTSTGRLFYLDPGELKEFQIGADDRDLGMLLKGIGQDPRGEIYVFGSTEVGPFGSTGRMLKIVSPEPPVTMAGITADESNATVSYTGGVGPYTVQQIAEVSDPVWMNLTTAPNGLAEAPLIGSQGFLRVADESLQPAVPMTIWLTGEASRPDPVTTPGEGFGSLSLQGNVLVFNIAYSDLPEVATAAHIHGPASVDETAGVLIDLEPFNGGGFGMSGSFSGAVTLTSHQRSLILQGKTYVNIHTPTHGPGEIRGQIVPVLFTTTLRGMNEVPNPVDTPGSGSGLLTLVGNRLTFNVTYRDLPVTATQAHIHAPATMHESGPVSIDLEPFNGGEFGTTGTLSGSVELTPPQFLDLISRRSYVNVHTSANPPGEIRGQLFPQISAAPLTALLSGEAERPDPVTTTATGAATVAVEGDNLHFELHYTGLSGTATMAHIHGPAGVEESAPVLIDLEPFNGEGFGESGVLSGVVKLTPEQKAHILGEQTYFNIHTEANGPGEIRGQIVNVLRKTALSGEAERMDPVDTPGDGFGLLMLVRDQLAFNITYSDLTGAATMAHIHGPAGFDENAGVLIDLEPFNGPGFGESGMLSGNLMLELDQRRFLIDQRTYINVHTPMHGPGEIRGQVTP